MVVVVVVGVVDKNQPLTMLHAALVQVAPARALRPRTARHRHFRRQHDSGVRAPGLTTRLSYPHSFAGIRVTGDVTPVKGQVQLSVGSFGEQGKGKRHLPGVQTTPDKQFTVMVCVCPVARHETSWTAHHSGRLGIAACCCSRCSRVAVLPAEGTAGLLLPKLVPAGMIINRLRHQPCHRSCCENVGAVQSSLTCRLVLAQSA